MIKAPSECYLYEYLEGVFETQEVGPWSGVGRAEVQATELWEMWIEDVDSPDAHVTQCDATAVVAVGDIAIRPTHVMSECEHLQKGDEHASDKCGPDIDYLAEDWIWNAFPALTGTEMIAPGTLAQREYAMMTKTCSKRLHEGVVMKQKDFAAKPRPTREHGSNETNLSAGELHHESRRYRNRNRTSRQLKEKRNLKTACRAWDV